MKSRLRATARAVSSSAEVEHAPGVSRKVRDGRNGDPSRLVEDGVLEQSALLLANGHEEQALLLLREAYGGGGPSFPGTKAQALSRLCAFALSRGIEVERVRRLVLNQSIPPCTEAQELESWPWPLRIYTFGRFEVVVDGEPIRWNGRAQQKRLEFLKVLLALGGRRVGEHRIAEALWPESSGDLQHRSLEITLHRLRRLLGERRAVELSEGRLTLDSGCCWVDAWAFERMLTRSEAETPGADCNGDRISLGRAALALYRGAFLAGDDAPWAVLPRDRLRSKFLRGVGRVGAALRETGEAVEAVHWYHKALEVEPLSEALCRSLMSCYAELDRNAEALAAYARFRDVLAKVLGREPSAETQALARAIRSRP